MIGKGEWEHRRGETLEGGSWTRLRSASFAAASMRNGEKGRAGIIEPSICKI